MFIIHCNRTFVLFSHKVDTGTPVPHFRERTNFNENRQKNKSNNDR